MTTSNNNYSIIGNGKRVLVFVHYFGGDAGSWQWLAKRLKKNHTCILLNLPGFGGTEPLKEPSIYEFAKYINNQIEELQLTDYILCGHSMGAKLVLYASKLMTGILPRKIILKAPSPLTTESIADEEHKKMMNYQNAGEAMHAVKGAIKRKLGKKMTYAVQSQLHIDEKTSKWWIEEGMQNNIAERIHGLNMPIHVIFSHEDPIVRTEAIYDEVLPHLEKPSVIALTKVGHLLPLKAPRKLARQIKRITKE